MNIAVNVVDKLKDAINLSDLISKRVKLTKKGKDYFGRCPFHNEKTPSFSVNDAKGFYHCFGCGAHGDIIGFVEATEGLNFAESLKYLAKTYGIQIPELDEKPNKENSILEEINVIAAKWFFRNLYSSKNAKHLQYLYDRGLANQYIKEFFLGYAPDSKDALIVYLKSCGYSESDIKVSGLVTIFENKGMIDKFRNRIMFPIVNTRKKIVGFGGRAVSDIKPKYLNSPETDLFRKREILYNENKLSALHKDKEIYVVEGYTDAISMHIAGIENVVATLGTSISEQHIQKLWRVSSAPTLCMDGDSAGLMAMARFVNVVLPLLRPGYSVKFVKLPKGMDPDDILKNYGSDYLKKLLEDKIDLCEAIWNIHVSQADLRTPETQALFKTTILNVTNQIQDPSVKKFYYEFFRSKIFPLTANMNKKPQRLSAKSEIIPAINISKLSTLERYSLTLLAIVLDYPYILTNAKTYEEFCSIEVESDYFQRGSRAVSTVFDNITDSENAEDFNKQFKLLISQQMPSSIINFLVGDNSYFLDKISVKNINNVVTSWDRTLAMYHLELLKMDYIKSVHCMNEQSDKVSDALKVQIDDQERWIKNNSNAE